MTSNQEVLLHFTCQLTIEMHFLDQLRGIAFQEKFRVAGCCLIGICHPQHNGLS
jgi:hypothetical protein